MSIVHSTGIKFRKLIRFFSAALDINHMSLIGLPIVVDDHEIADSIQFESGSLPRSNDHTINAKRTASIGGVFHCQPFVAESVHYRFNMTRPLIETRFWHKNKRPRRIYVLHSVGELSSINVSGTKLLLIPF